MSWPDMTGDDLAADAIRLACQMAVIATHQPTTTYSEHSTSHTCATKMLSNFFFGILFLTNIFVLLSGDVPDTLGIHKG